MEVEFPKRHNDPSSGVKLERLPLYQIEAATAATPPIDELQCFEAIVTTALMF
jgi:hypothetical protein